MGILSDGDLKSRKIEIFLLETDLADVCLETGLASRTESVRNSRQRPANPKQASKGGVFFITCAPARGIHMR